MKVEGRVRNTKITVCKMKMNTIIIGSMTLRQKKLFKIIKIPLIFIIFTENVNLCINIKDRENQGSTSVTKSRA